MKGNAFTTLKYTKERDYSYLIHKKNYCEECGTTGLPIGRRDEDGYLISKSSNNPLTVHHIDHNRDNNDVSNLQTLCTMCHRKKHE